MFRPYLGGGDGLLGWVVRAGLPRSCDDQLSCEGSNGCGRCSAADWGLEWCEAP